MHRETVATSDGPTIEHLYNDPMLLTKREKPILIVNAIYIPIFTAMALMKFNYEFVLYVGVILVVASLILWKQRTVKFDLPVLWGLTIWGLMHLSGGNIRVGGEVLYSLDLIPIVPSYHILRYDQVVHLLGFGVATLMCHHILKPYLREQIDHWPTLMILVVLMGSGVGAINEIVEFIAVVLVPETGVGGYTNTVLDLVFNLLGGVLAAIYLSRRRATESPS